MSLNWVDVLLVLLVAFGVAAGWRRGFILSSLEFARWTGSLAAGLCFYQTVSGWLEPLTDWTATWNQPVAFILVVVAAGVSIQIAGAVLLRRIPKDAHESRINKIFGIFPGTASGLILAAIVSALLFSVPFSDRSTENARKSFPANRLAVYTDRLETALAPVFDDAIRQTLNRRTTAQPGSNERAELPFKIENTRPRPELEAQMLELVNQERIAGGLAPLEADPELAAVARKHSADMFARGYFSHNTPEGSDPFDRIRAASVRFRTAGENLALAPTVQIAHRGLMNSPGHRANILRPAFGRLGIGILDGGRRGLMVTQNFRN